MKAVYCIIITVVVLSCLQFNCESRQINEVTAGDHKTKEQWKKAWQQLAELEQEYLKEGSGCKCVNYNCGCCLNLDVKEIKIDDTACFNVSYLPDQYGISVTFSIDGKVYINETVSARNPPPICIGIPHFEKDASICLDLYNLDITKSAFTGCAKLEARLYHVKVRDVELGCFNMPLAERQRNPKLEHAKYLKYVKSSYLRFNRL